MKQSDSEREERRKLVLKEVFQNLQSPLSARIHAQMILAAPEMMRLLLQVKDSHEQGQCENWFNEFPERINKLLISVFTDEYGPWYDEMDESIMPEHLRDPSYTELYEKEKV